MNASNRHLIPRPVLTTFMVMALLMVMAACQSQSKQLEKATALYQQGMECATDDPVAAIEACHQALLTLSRCDQNDLEVIRLTAQTTDLLGTRYWKNGLIDNALQLHQQAVALSRQINDSTLLMTALRNTGRVASSLHDVALVQASYEEALQISTCLKQQEFSNELLVELARDVYMELGNYGKAIDAASQALQGGVRQDLCYLTLGLSNYYIENDSLAITYLNQALKSEKAGVRMPAYQGLYFIYQLQEDYPRALECYERFNENLLLSEHEQRTEEVQRIKGEYELKAQELSLKSSQHLKNLTLYLLLSLLCFALLFTLLLLRQRTLPARLKSEEVKNQLETSLKKNKVFVTALALSEQITASSLDFNIGESEWEDFMRLIDMIHGGFTQKLLAKYPTLSKGDLQICCLTRQGFSNQVIAILMNLQNNSFARRKYRIKQDKMNGAEDERSFEDIINDV